MRLTAAQVDRACGVLVASAVGDALGAGYEFGSAAYSGWPAMIGGGLGGFAPGEWTDDTAQALAIAEVAATGGDLHSEGALDAIAQRFADWYAAGPADVGIQTSAVLSAVGRAPSAATMRAAAAAVHARSGRTAGNGSLMRTAPVALAHLDDPAALVVAAMKVSALTHHDPLAGQGAALWCLMIRHAVLTGALPAADDVLPHLPDADHWAGLLREAEECEPSDFTANGWVVGALQAAWSAITHTPVREPMACRHLQESLAAAIAVGHDTDTVAAIAGALLGARWGVSAVPQEWLARLHGWPGMTARDLVRLAILTAQRGTSYGGGGWPECERMDYRGYGGEATYVPHPLVDGVWIGGALPLDDLPREIDAVVSLCRIGTTQVAEGLQTHVVRLLDTVADDNPNIDFVVDDAARTVLRLRDEGKRVYLHCVASHSRTPTVAARVGVLAGHELDESLRAVMAVLPAARPQRFLVDALRRLSDVELDVT